MKSNRILIITAAVLTNIFWLCVIDFRPSTDKLVEDLNARLIEQSFEGLYDQSSDLLRLNVTKEQFVHRMKAAGARMRAVDPTLRFRRDRAQEESLDRVTGRYDSFQRRAIQRLGEEGKGVVVLSHWDGKGKFESLTLLPEPGAAAGYKVHTILYKE